MAEKRAWLTDPETGEKFHAWSHVKSIFYNKATNILLKDKLDEMDRLIDEKIKKAMMSNVQVNDQNKVPTSALVYTMQQGITNNRDAVDQLNRDIGSGYFKIHIKTTTIVLMVRECNFSNGKCSVPAEELFGYIPKWGSAVCQSLLLNESVVVPSMYYDNSNAYTITLQNKLDYTGIAWITAMVIANIS